MTPKGICKDCRYRWQYGAKGEPQHLYCTKRGSFVKNTKMKSCKEYIEASEEQKKNIRKRSYIT